MQYIFKLEVNLKDIDTEINHYDVRPGEYNENIIIHLKYNL